MKAALLLTLALAGCATDPKITECKAHAERSFERFRAAATTLASAPAKSYMQSASLHFRSGMQDEDKHDLNGKAVFHTADVFIDAERLCSGPRFELDRVIAHELGHLLSYTEVPDIAEAGRRATPGSIEVWGNEYGAQIAAAAGFNPEAYLTLADTRCGSGIAYACEQAMAWRYGTDPWFDKYNMELK